MEPLISLALLVADLNAQVRGLQEQNAELQRQLESNAGYEPTVR